MTKTTILHGDLVASVPVTRRFDLSDGQWAAYDTAAEQRYDDLPDRRVAFDHAITTTLMDTVVLPQLFDEVIDGTDRPVEHGLIVSAHRLRIESVALGYAFRYVESRFTTGSVTAFSTTIRSHTSMRALRTTRT